MAINKVILVGNVGKDPEVKYFENNNAVANFTLATTERGYTAANGTVIPDRTEWHNIVCWRGLAKVAEQWVRKGGQVYIEGKIRTRSYDDANGVKRYMTEIYADNLELLGGRRKDADGTVPESAPFLPKQNQQIQQTASTTPTQNVEPPTYMDEVDDLPF